MSQPLINRMFSFASSLFFEEISPKFQVDALKNMMDFLYIFYEKIFRHFDVFVQLYFDMYDELVTNEIQLAHITSDMNILVIGCGSLPATSVLLTRKTGATVLGVDKDKKAVDDAATFIDSTLEHTLSFTYSKDLSLDLASFDIVIVAYGIKQQSSVFETLSDQMKKKACIIYRVPFNVDEQEVVNDINQKGHFTFVKKIMTSSMGSTVSLLLQNNS